MTEVVELGERALVPAFVDTHQHFASFSTFYASLNVMDASSNREMNERLYNQNRMVKMIEVC